MLESDAILLRRGPITKAMTRRLQEDWARGARENIEEQGNKVN